jgi:hypothetical protein
MTSSREIIPSNWPSGFITGKLRTLRPTINCRTRVNGNAGVDMHDRLGHHVLYRPPHQFIVMRHSLAAGEGKGAKEIELGDDPQDLSVFHNRKRIEVVFFEQPSQFAHCRLRLHGRHRPRHELSRRAREKAVHSSTTSITRLHSLDFLFVSSATRVCPIVHAHKPNLRLADEGMAVLSLARP